MINVDWEGYFATPEVFENVAEHEPVMGEVFVRSTVSRIVHRSVRDATRLRRAFRSAGVAAVMWDTLPINLGDPQFLFEPIALRPTVEHLESQHDLTRNTLNKYYWFAVAVRKKALDAVMDKLSFVFQLEYGFNRLLSSISPRSITAMMHNKLSEKGGSDV